MRENDTGKKNTKSLPGKKRMITALLLLLAAGVVTAATWSFYTAQSNYKTNPLFPMTVTDIDINEPNGSEYTMDAAGTVTTKKVIIENPDGNAKKPVFIRVAVVPSIKDKQGGYLNKEVTIDPKTAFHENWTLHDGYYYYKYPVMPGAQTTELFQNSTVTLSCGLQDGEYVQLDVIADTVQAAANGDETETLTTQFAKKAWNYDRFILVQDNTGNNPKKNVG